MMNSFNFTYFNNGKRTECAIVARDSISAVCIGLKLLSAPPARIICSPVRKS